MIKISLFEDHTLLREGIRSTLLNNSEITVTGESPCTTEAADKLLLQKNDLAIIGLNLDIQPGIDFIRYIRLKHPLVKLIILSGTHDLGAFIEIMKLGVTGYLLKESGTPELLFAIRKVVHENGFVCTEMAFSLLDNIHLSYRPAAAENTRADISKRELEVLALIAEGFTNQEIAEKTFTSKRTIETHRKNLLEKTGCRNTAALIRFSMAQGIISPPAPSMPVREKEIPKAVPLPDTSFRRISGQELR